MIKSRGVPNFTFNLPFIFFAINLSMFVVNYVTHLGNIRTEQFSLSFFYNVALPLSKLSDFTLLITVSLETASISLCV